MKVYEFFINSTERVRQCVLWLVDQGMWFEVMPLPYDEYKVSIRAEEEFRLKHLGEVVS